MIGVYTRISLSLMLLLKGVSISYAQDCKLPILSGFSNQTTNTVELEWLDFNQDALSWDLEYGEKDFLVTGQPTLSGILQKNVLIDNLNSGTTYEFYLRARCQSVMNSGWNGPYFTNTAIDNDNACGLSFELSDNNCPLQDVFKIDISGFQDYRLGVDLVLEQVDLIIEHPWPPDLRLKLISPDGQEIRLSTNNGKGIDDYGDAGTESCEFPVQFTDNACEAINNIDPPFVGQYRPEEPISNLYSMNSPDGIWELSICDYANGDLGFLKYVKLRFSEMACIVPPSFSLEDIEADKVTFAWVNSFDCSALELVYKEKSAPVQESFVEYETCDAQAFTILDLKPDTEYELIVRADCGNAVFSPESCLMSFRTACENSTLREDFDQQSNCTLSCSDPCVINSIWRNAELNQSNWIINEGPTPTSFTGPLEDTSKDGKYIYIENQANICSDALNVILRSTCLTKPETSSCALSFSYHMNGQDIGSLSVEYSIDNINWTEVWSLAGSQEDKWQNETVDIPISFGRGQIRFKAFKRSNAIRGDIAIDNIKLINIDTIVPLQLYEDRDGDGYGNSEKPFMVCSNVSVTGYSDNDMDCDDMLATVYPGAPEIKCNQIDENCNGPDDDANLDQLAYVLGNVRSESCKGSADGFVTIEGINGQEPYSYKWSNGDEGQGATDLTTGIYYCTISDIGGCEIVSDPIFIGFTDILVYSIASMDNPSCFGENDGELEIRIEGGLPPYQIVWNNGRRGSRISTLNDGQYYATISDATNCEIVIDSILLEGPQILTTGIQTLIDADCNGNASGLVRLGIIGGTPPYDILWNNGENQSIINNKPAGIYSATVTDQNGCFSVVEDIEILEPDVIEILLVSVENISCPGNAVSLIDINVIGGTPPYSFFWSDNSNGQDLINRPAGLYSVTVSDFNSCATSLQDIEILQPEEIEIAVSESRNVRCFGSQNGYLEVEVSGGTPPYSYNWGIRDGEESDENFLSDLNFGNYSLTVVDGFNCKSRAITIPIVNNSIPLEVALETERTLDCFGDSTGMISADVGAALLPLDFNWSSGQNVVTMQLADTLSGLIAGSYDLTVTDGEGCVGIGDSVMIPQPSEIQYTLVALMDNICWGDSTGSIDIAVDGGEAPYSVNWSEGSEGEEIDFLANGDYSATITDTKNCRAEVSDLQIDSEAAIGLDLIIDHPTESTLGKIEVVTEGGISPLQYEWGTPIEFVNSAIAANLEVGFYKVTVTDILGCAQDTIIELKIATSNAKLTRESQIIISPNPSSGVFNLDLKLGHYQAGKLSVLNNRGEIIVRENYYSKEKNLDLSYLPTGVYLVRIELGGSIFISKVILIH